MRSVNLILRRRERLADWAPILAARGKVSLYAQPSVARREGHPDGFASELTVARGPGVVQMMDRPTSVNEYSPTELAELAALLGGPAGMFIAVDYADERLFTEVLLTLLNWFGPGAIVVDDPEPACLLEHFVNNRT